MAGPTTRTRSRSTRPVLFGALSTLAARRRRLLVDCTDSSGAPEASPAEQEPLDVALGAPLQEQPLQLWFDAAGRLQLAEPGAAPRVLPHARPVRLTAAGGGLELTVRAGFLTVGSSAGKPSWPVPRDVKLFLYADGAVGYGDG